MRRFGGKGILMNQIYTAEDCGGNLFMVASWLGLDRASFRELVLDRLEKDGIPEPDRNIQQLGLCEYQTWSAFRIAPEACYGHLYWTYPGVWSENHVTKMPPELAAEFWDGEGVERTDPKHPDFHDTMAGVWDNREK
jgi:hypothetical protein